MSERLAFASGAQVPHPFGVAAWADQVPRPSPSLGIAITGAILAAPVRLSIFRIRSLLSANIAMFFFNALYIQRVLGYGPLKAGLAFLPFTAGVMISGGLASQFAPRLGVRPVAAVGMLLAAAGLALLTQLPVHGSHAANVLPSVLLSSLGLAVLSTLAASKTSSAGGSPMHALVVGFHWVFAAGAVVMVA